MSVGILKAAARPAAKLGALTAVAAVAVGVFGAGMASAADKELTFSGEFPIIGVQSVKTVVHVDIPANVKPGDALDVPFSLDVDAGAAAGDGLRLVGATKVSGDIKSSVTLTVSDGQSVPLSIALPIPETPVPAEGPLVFKAEGAVKFTVPGGVPTGEAKINVDPKAVSHIITDSDLGEFDVNLALDPPDQDTLLGTTQIG
ncbi:DUF6801 domain-containing protein [Amycolatopsis nigrescens]|uniref:DUF6801 domain-containing protein n=1 Tax=Amycolatopsis nigrescens TaxID=381445 RepID=UPI0004774D9D|nr:DUF6801 domain-containing protein [Amycolatopsis nigrescens]